ncbi:retrovirus-related pol polyprotein from transposon TNT 1-94 [Tanacetum coccineum]
MSQDVMICVMNSTAVFDDVNVEMRSSESCVKYLDLDAELLKKQNAYNDLSKTQLQAKDTTICKLKEHIKSMRENVKEEKFKHEMDKIETINIELEHSVAKLLSGNERLHKEIEHLKKIYKDQFDSIKKTCAPSKEHNDSLIGKETVENVAQTPIATTITPSMFKIDLEPLAPRLLNHRDAHIDYLKHTQEQADILRGIVEQAKAKQPLDNALDFASMYIDANHDVCFFDFVNDVNMHAKSKSKSKKSQVHNNWKPTGKVFTDVGLKWKPTGRLFTIVGNSCPLTRTTPKKIVHLKETTSNSVETPKPEIKVYSRRPKQIKSVGSSKKAKIVESKNANNSKPNHTWGSNATDIPSSSSLVNDRLSRLFSGTVRFRNDQVAKIMGFGDYQLGNIIISRVYYNLEGVDLHSGSRDTNLYTISLDDMLKMSSIYLLSKASKTKRWLWHRRLSHLNFESINGKKYILVIVDDYSRFTWVRFLRSKDEAPDAIIKCIKNIQVRLNATIRNVRTDNGTEFFNQTLCDFYENVGISHQTSIARTP